MRTLFFILALAFGVQAQTVEISWDKNTETDLSGYKVYFSADSLNLNLESNVGLGTTDPADPARIKEGLKAGNSAWTWDSNKRYFSAVTAYDVAGNESEFSDIIGFEVKDKSKPATVDNIKIVVIDENGNVSVFVKQE